MGRKAALPTLVGRFDLDLFANQLLQQLQALLGRPLLRTGQLEAHQLVETLHGRMTAQLAQHQRAGLTQAITLLHQFGKGQGHADAGVILHRLFQQGNELERAALALIAFGEPGDGLGSKVDVLLEHPQQILAGLLILPRRHRQFGQSQAGTGTSWIDTQRPLELGKPRWLVAVAQCTVCLLAIEMRDGIGQLLALILLQPHCDLNGLVPVT